MTGEKPESISKGSRETPGRKVTSIPVFGTSRRVNCVFRQKNSVLRAFKKDTIAVAKTSDS